MSSTATWRRVGVAGAISAVAHVLVGVFGTIELPEAPPDRMPVAVRLVSAPAPAVPAPRAAAAVQRAAYPGVRVAEAARGSSPVPVAAGGAEEASVVEAEPVETADVPAHEPPIAAVSEPINPAVAAEPQPAVRTLPRKGRVTYDFVYGRDRFPVGRTVQTWEIDGARYQLASRSETTGLADLIRSQHYTYSSRGALTRDGLQPEAFKMNRNRGRGRANEEATARFDWKQSTVTLGRAAELRQEKLPPRSQDLLSFIFQLALDPPAPGRLTQVVTTGSRLEVYELDVRREELIETPMGVLRTLPIKQVRKVNQESIELWLAVEYRYLPVRVRIFDRAGEPQGEQIASDIRLIEH